MILKETDLLRLKEAAAETSCNNLIVLNLFF